MSYPPLLLTCMHFTQNVTRSNTANSAAAPSINAPASTPPLTVARPSTTTAPGPVPFETPSTRTTTSSIRNLDEAPPAADQSPVPALGGLAGGTGNEPPKLDLHRSGTLSFGNLWPEDKSDSAALPKQMSTSTEDLGSQANDGIVASRNDV